ncbi:hypothetical protein [Evtepia sp.]|uniref:hypothetical protein n=1 Tax=Evtepia sp. TaxID=2773933 RepID=UPI002A83CE72|nr:hypothetical protein [Evtepia sp.]MDY4429769.1 hypothetical protein [Evtepia sp.]
MSLLEDYIHRNVPEYYPTMYLDGYTPVQIMYAHRKMALKMVKERNQEIELSNQQKKSLENAVDKAMDDIFAGWV